MGRRSVPYYGGRPNDGFAPVKALRRDDADVSIMFMTPNSITYGDVVHDPFFAADLNRRSVNVDGQNITFYLSNYCTCQSLTSGLTRQYTNFYRCQRHGLYRSAPVLQSK